jgi:hypothetical protein
VHFRDGFLQISPFWRECRLNAGIRSDANSYNYRVHQCCCCCCCCCCCYKSCCKICCHCICCICKSMGLRGIVESAAIASDIQSERSAEQNPNSGRLKKSVVSNRRGIESTEQNINSRNVMGQRKLLPRPRVFLRNYSNYLPLPCQSSLWVLCRY